MNNLHDYERYLCNNFIPLCNEMSGRQIPKNTGVYMLGIMINNHIIPVYIGRACERVQHLWLRSRRYIRVLNGSKGDDYEIDNLLKGVNNPKHWYISWLEFTPELAKQMEFELLRNTNLKLVNAIGMRKGCSKKAKNNACWYVELYTKLNS